MIAVGIDAGSRALKIILWDMEHGRVLASEVIDQGIEQRALSRGLLDKMLAIHAGGSAAGPIVATGYGRNLLDFADATITEITCHARGVRHLLPDARTIIEIGGQDSKVIHLEPGGLVRDFTMNDRCAAGTGCFLEVVSRRMGLDLEALDRLALSGCDPAIISSMCVVFAETEIIGLLAEGRAPGAIAAGVQAAMTSRVIAMAGRNVSPPICFTGGVARLPGMVRALAGRLDCPVEVAPAPQFTGALGAALLAAERYA
jgi:predicted CoA-substrate-specific enzyme activase